MVTRECSTCGQLKLPQEYRRDRSKPTGCRAMCKACEYPRLKPQIEAYQRTPAGKLAKKKRDKRRSRDLEVRRQRRVAYDPAKRRAAYAANKEAYQLRNRRWEQANRDKRRAIGTRRKRLLAEAVQEPYRRADIFERDSWVCQLCQEPVDPDLVAPDPRSASIDHVVPLSLGGDDTPANVQTAHFGCNSAKGNNTSPVRTPPP